MGIVSTLTHASFDIVLLSVCLAGIRRSTGLTFQTSYFTSKNHRKILEFVVGVGENVFDIAVAFMSAYPSVFKRQTLPPPPSSDHKK